MYTNPIIPGFAADPSVCYAEGYYYLVTSTFAFLPGISIYKSKDLINWYQIGNVFDSIEEVDWNNIDINGGVWAPTIRYYNGEFFVCAAIEKVGNLITHTLNPQGEWSKPVWVDIGGVDPSLLFEDGNAYFCTNDWSDGTPGVWVGIVDPYTGEKKEDFKCVYKGNRGGWLEAPHIYHIEDWYYIFAAEGGTYTGHMEIVARAHDILGPYENCPYNPILTNRNDTSKAVSCTGHGDLVMSVNGRYYMVHLGCRPGTLQISPLGRETFLTAVNFVDGWPVVQDSMAVINNDDEDLFEQKDVMKNWNDTFESGDWPAEWKFLRGKGKRNFIRNKGLVVTLNDYDDSEVFSYVRQPDLKFECSTVIDMTKTILSDSSMIGIRVFLSDEFNLFFGIKNEQDIYKCILVQKAGNIAVVHVNADIQPTDQVKIKVEGNEKNYYFSTDCVELSGTKYTVSNRFISPVVMDRGFVGTMLGLGAVKNKHEVRGLFKMFSLKTNK